MTSNSSTIDEMKAELNEFLNNLSAEVESESESELRNEFRKHMTAAREFKEQGNIQLIAEFYTKAWAITTFLEAMKK